jgi:hypothetical protein
MRILVRPAYANFLENRLFEPIHPHAAHWMAPYVRMREKALARGWEMETWDRRPLESADVVLFQDLPERRSEVDAARAKAPKARFILQLVESPLSRPHSFVKANHDLFDAILTYNWQICDEKRYFHYYLPLGLPPESAADPSFEDRRPLVMINTNRWLGILSTRKTGMSGLPFVGPLFSGWKIPIGKLLSQNHGEQYSHRRSLARQADERFPGLLDVYGAGWAGEPMSWVHRFIGHRSFASAKVSSEGKAEILRRYRFAIAFENLVEDVGYISEKILDPIYFGTVPIYLGDARISDFVPAECFVDASKFNSDHDLLSFVRDCPEGQWRDFRRAGDHYRASSQIMRFQPDSFSETVMKVIERVTA